MKSTHREG